MLTKPIGERPEWDDQTRVWFLEQIADDNERLLEFAGKPKGFWKLNSDNVKSRVA